MSKGNKVSKNKVSDDMTKKIAEGGVVDLYKYLNKGSDGVVEYTQKGNIFKHPARVLIMGPSGKGKTTIALQLALSDFDFDTLTIFGSSLHQPLFRQLCNIIAAKVKKIGGDLNDYLHVSSEIDKKFSDFDPSLQHLVIFDDMAKRDDKRAPILAEYASFGRPYNISMIVTCQGFYYTNKDLRENMSYFIAFRMNSPQDKRDFLSYAAPDLTPDERMRIYLEATSTEQEENMDEDQVKEVNKEAFFFVDMNETKKSKKYRRAFVEGSIYQIGSGLGRNSGVKDLTVTKKKSQVKYEMGPEGYLLHPKDIKKIKGSGWQNEERDGDLWKILRSDQYK